MRYRVIPRPGKLPCIAAGLMLLAMLLRIIYYAGRFSGGPVPDAVETVCQLALPLLSGAVFLPAVLRKDGRLYALSVLAVFLGVLFFIVKAQGFAHQWHTILCTLLYLVVFMLHTITALGVLGSLWPQRLVYGLPLAFHLAQDAFFPEASFLANPLPELSVLCIMAALLCLTLSLELRPLRPKA